MCCIAIQRRYKDLIDMSKSKRLEREYDLKASAAQVGYLYPVLATPDGEIIVGASRLEADSAWPVQIREDLNTPLKITLARLTENLHRRSLPEA